MKVLQINSVCGIRSTGRICTDIAEILERHGHQCKIAYGRETVPEKHQKYAVRIGSNLGIKVDGLLTRLFDNAGFHSVPATKKFIKWVKEYDPDIIHLHNIHGYYLNLPLLFKYLKESGKPVVWTLHDCWPFTGHCTYFDLANCDKWKTGCKNCPQKKEYPASILLDNSENNYKRKNDLFNSLDNLQFIAISDWIAQQKEQSYLQSKPITVIHNGIDLTQFTPTQSNFRKDHSIENKRMYLGVCSFWDRRKGFDTFLKLSEMLRDDEVIVLVGVSEEQLQVLPGNIIGIKKTNSVQQLAEIYSAADVFLNPTIEEGLGLVNIEAISCGTPVVTYNSGGSPECISEKCGVVVPKGDIDALLGEARRISFPAEQVVSEAQRFDKNKKYEEYLQLYERCLE